MTMKVVGRKRAARVDVVAADSLQKLANVLRQGRPFVPKGVWRFKSFEEADAWLIEMMTRRKSHDSQH
ncbi:MAG: hypothetical protein HY674_14440 [Chloroflexi bacterium]|nr:hypothetical protein [Chloroflexota bacterium]